MAAPRNRPLQRCPASTLIGEFCASWTSSAVALVIQRSFANPLGDPLIRVVAILGPHHVQRAQRLATRVSVGTALIRPARQPTDVDLVENLHIVRSGILI